MSLNYVVQDDEQFNMTFTIKKKDGTAFDLTGNSNVKFSMWLPGSTTPKIDEQNMTVDPDPTTGKVTYNFQSGDLDTPGKYLAEMKVTFGSGKVQTAPTVGDLYIMVRRKAP